MWTLTVCYLVGTADSYHCTTLGSTANHDRDQLLSAIASADAHMYRQDIKAMLASEKIAEPHCAQSKLSVKHAHVSSRRLSAQHAKLQELRSASHISDGTPTA